MTARRLLGALVCVGALLAPGAAGAAGAMTESPTLVANALNGQVGDLVPLTLEHWPTGLVTVSVCGNAGARGSQDCDLRSAFTLNMPPGGGMRARVRLVQPPVDCPCVIRAATSTNDLVRDVPIEIVGVPMGTAPPPAATSVSAAGLTARARVLDDGSWTDAFGVGVTRTLRVTLHNRGPSATPTLDVGGAVGRSVENGESFSTREVGKLAPGARRTVDVPISLSTPAHGDYVVYGTVYGLDAPVRFRAETANDPWALWLLVPLALIVVARILRRRERARRRDAEVGTPPQTPRTEIVLEPFLQCSPEVGDGDQGRYPSHSYDPDDPRREPAASAASLV